MKTRCGIAYRKDFSARAERASEREDHTLRTKPQTGKKPSKQRLGIVKSSFISQTSFKIALAEA